MFCTHFSIAIYLLVAAYAPDFGAPTLYGADVGPIAKGDFNGDGRMDLVVSGNGRLLVLLGQGDGSFQTAIASPARVDAYTQIVIADFNGDGKLDLAGVSNDYIVIQYGVGDGTFRAPEGPIPVNGGEFQHGSWTLAAAGDVNGDGAVDLVVLAAGYDLWIFMNHGDGTFDVTEWPGVDDWGFYGVFSIDLIDLDRDGTLDVVIGGGTSFTIFFGNGTNSSGGFGDWSPGLAMGDFNGDGNLDLMVGQYGNTVGFLPLFGRGDGTFDNGPTFPANGPMTPGAADFNRDGKLDLIGTNSWIPGMFEVHLGDGIGAFYVPKVFQTGGAAYTRALIIDDLNADGYPDVIAAIGPNIHVVMNDGVGGPPMPAVVIGNCSVLEGNSGTRPAVFTVTLNPPPSTTVTVEYATENGTAAAGEDYIATTGMLTFAPGEAAKTITVQVIGDRIKELNETFRVRLTAATGAVIVHEFGEGVIIDDEPSISIDDVAMREGRNRQTTSFMFTVTLSQPYDAPVTASYRTVDGTATALDDYVAKSGTLVFAPGETTKTIKIDVKGDNKREPNEYFCVDLYGASPNAAIYQGRGMGTILNDD